MSAFEGRYWVSDRVVPATAWNGTKNSSVREGKADIHEMSVEYSRAVQRKPSNVAFTEGANKILYSPSVVATEIRLKIKE